MSVRRIPIGAGQRRRAPLPGGPIVEALIDADDDRPIGVLHVTVPPGGRMPEHDHGASEMLLIPVSGAVRLIESGAADLVTELSPGALATIPVGRRVQLENPGEVEATLIVVCAPPDFVDQVSSWPQVEIEPVPG